MAVKTHWTPKSFLYFRFFTQRQFSANEFMRMAEKIKGKNAKNSEESTSL